MPFYFLPHDYSYDLIFLISLSMLIITISIYYSDGILWISITPYDDTLLIVLTCSTLIPTYAKSS